MIIGGGANHHLRIFLLPYPFPSSLPRVLPFLFLCLFLVLVNFVGTPVHTRIRSATNPVVGRVLFFWSPDRNRIRISTNPIDRVLRTGGVLGKVLWRGFRFSPF